jgi:2-dehydro-3-deoxyphosphogluconate aldolase/(4S)-4-hydroxy-2-oxoglutarate aldolase
MMHKRGHRDVQECLERSRILAVARLKQMPMPLDLVDVLADAGLTCLEICMTMPGALATLREVRDRYHDRLVVGAGSVVNAEMARLALQSGAEFIAGPGFNEAMCEACRRADVLPLPGVMTPSEALHAWHSGAHLLKLFPAGPVGPAFLAKLMDHLPWARFIPAGGITAGNAPAFFAAGALAVAVGDWLISEDLVSAADWGTVRDRALALKALAAKFPPPG